MLTKNTHNISNWLNVQNHLINSISLIILGGYNIESYKQKLK